MKPFVLPRQPRNWTNKNSYNTFKKRNSRCNSNKNTLGYVYCSWDFSRKWWDCTPTHRKREACISCISQTRGLDVRPRDINDGALWSETITELPASFYASDSPYRNWIRWITQLRIFAPLHALSSLWYSRYIVRTCVNIFLSYSTVRVLSGYTQTNEACGGSLYDVPGEPASVLGKS